MGTSDLNIDRLSDPQLLDLCPVDPYDGAPVLSPLTHLKNLGNDVKHPHNITIAISTAPKRPTSASQ